MLEQKGVVMRPLRKPIIKACIEIAFIVFLFYSNLLMGEFTKRTETGRTWEMAFEDIFTSKNFVIALVSAAIGFVFFETIRKRLD
jgi:hypothetical protein